MIAEKGGRDANGNEVPDASRTGSMQTFDGDALKPVREAADEGN